MIWIPEDNVLVERLRAGDIEAFDIVYDKYSHKLYSFGLKYLRSTDEAQELVQSVFLKVWENRSILKRDTSFRSYLFTIAYNDMCKLFRKRSYQQKFINETLYENSQLSFSIEDNINYKSVLDSVQQIINKLPEKQKMIFLKSRNEGKSTREIAKEVGLAPGTIDNYISEALKSIRAGLKNENLILFLFFFLFLA